VEIFPPPFAFVVMSFVAVNIPVAPRENSGKLEFLRKNCGHAERGFWSFSEALAKAQVANPVTEPKRS
jgi:hypothetical protein